MPVAGHIFVSHAGAEGGLAKGWCDWLEAGGFGCWLAPRDIPAGADWAEKVIDAIDSAAAMLLLLGPAACTSVQVRREIERAVHREVPVVTLRAPGVELSRSLKYFLGAHQWLEGVDLGDAALRDAVGRSLQQLLLGSPPTATQTNPVGPQSGGALHAAPPFRPPFKTGSAIPSPDARWLPDRRTADRIAARLAVDLGPVADIFVQRAMARAAGSAAAVETLAGEIADPAARAAFIADVAALLQPDGRA
jgi:hypothetical protein